LGVVALGVSWAPGALADALDPALSRLIVSSECRTQLGAIVDDEGVRERLRSEYVAAGLSGRDGLCAPDNAAFKKLVAQWGFALAPNAMYPARTTGFGGFHFSVQAAYTAIDSEATYWKLGTEGERDSASGSAATSGSPPGIIQNYSLNVRKNFILGIEALANVGIVPGSSIINGGADVRLALLEGFRTGVGGVFPDVSVGAGVRTITGTEQLQLTTAALDVRASKPFPIASQGVLTPWIGYQHLWIFGRSGLIDLTPGTDPLGYCGFSGSDIPNATNNSNAESFDGQPVCRGGSSLDYNNNAVFSQANLERQRFLFGLNYRYEVVSLGVQYLTDLVDPASAQNSEQDKRDLAVCSDGDVNCESMPRQWQLGIEIGAHF
jgi:hypothetical protein